MLDRKLDAIRRIDARARTAPPAVSYNPGTMSDPLPAVERAMAAFRRSARGRPFDGYENCRAVLGDLRAVAAEVLGGRPSEWAHADGHTATIDRIAATLAQFLDARTDVPVPVVSTDSEHVGGLGAFIADPRFAVTRVAPERLAETPARIYFLSHLTYDTNRDLGREIAALGARRDAVPDPAAAPIVVVDGTQAVGQIPVDVAALGCDAYLASAHKWLGGPHGSGLLYLRESVIERWPTPFRAGEPLVADLPIGRWEPRGGQDFARVAGIAAALRAYQCHATPGAAVREAFVAALAGALGDAARVLPTSAPNGRTVAVELPGIDVYPVYRHLVMRGISVKCIKRPAADEASACDGLAVLRMGFPWWSDADAPRRAVAAIAEALHAARTAEGVP